MLAGCLCLGAFCPLRAFVVGAISPSLGNVASRGRGADRATAMEAHWMDVLKNGGSTPSFDVLERTKEYAQCKGYEERRKFHAVDYVFRGSIVGPMVFKDIEEQQKKFNVQEAYPDLELNPFGFSIDPENPFRCVFFERWTGTHTGELKFGPFTLPATGKRARLPTHVMSVTWNAEGKVAYDCVSPPVDRFEGTTEGAGAIFGLLVNAGLEQFKTVGVGHPLLVAQQKIGSFFGQTSHSEVGKLPSWWKSKAIGAESNDM